MALLKVHEPPSSRWGAVQGYAFNGVDNDFALARYNNDGGLDTSFGGDGKVTTPFGPGDDVGTALVLQENGKIIMAGYTYNGANYDFALARYWP